MTGSDPTKQLIKTSDYTVSYEDDVHAGTGTAKAVFTSSTEGNYSGSVTKKYDISPVDITISAKTASSVYGGGIADLSKKYSVTDGHIADGDDLQIVPVTMVNKTYSAGDYKNAITITYDTGNTDYNVTTEKADYTITKAALSVTGENYSGVYDGKAHKAKVTAKTGKLLTSAVIYYSKTGTIDPDNCTGLTEVMPEFTDADDHTVYYCAKCDNYEPVLGTVKTDIGKAEVKVTAPSDSVTYGDDPAALLSGFSADDLVFDGFIGSDDYESEKTIESLETFGTSYDRYDDAGTYRIDVNGLEMKDYTPSYVPGILTADKKKVTFTWPSKTELTYNGSDQEFCAGITASDKVRAEDDVTVGDYEDDTTDSVIYSCCEKDAGQYTSKVISLSGTKACDYMFDPDDETVKRSWSVIKANNSFTISPVITGWTAGKSPNAPVSSAKYGIVSYEYGSSESGPFTSDVPTEAGTYFLRAYVPAGADYNELEKIISFEIKAAGAQEDKIITITAPSLPEDGDGFVYGDDLNLSGYTAEELTDSGLVTGLTGEQTLADVSDGTLSFDTGYVKGSGVGTYMIMPKGLTADMGYEIVYKPGYVTASKKNLNLNWSEDSFIYDGNAHSVTAGVNDSDLITGDSISVTGYEYNAAGGITNSASDAGSYIAHAISFAGNGYSNYSVNTAGASHTWSISKAQSGDSANSFTKEPSIAGWTYGETASDPAGTAKYGTVRFVYSDDQNGTYTSEKPSDAGVWYMKGIVDGTDNYETISSTAVSFTISRANVTIYADDKESAKGSAISKLTYNVSGTIQDKDLSSLAIKASTTATSASKTGEYPITISYTANDDYDITTVPGTYHVTLMESGLTVTSSGYSGVYDGASHGISVTASDAEGRTPSGMKVYYSLDETELTDKLYNSALTSSPEIKDVGSITVYYYVKTDDYKPVTGSKEVVISQKEVTVTTNNTELTYGSAPAGNGVVYSGFVGDDSAQTLGLLPQYDFGGYEQYDRADYYQIKAKGLPENGNYKYVYVKGRLKINPKPVSFTWSADSLVYDGTEKKIAATVVGLVNSDVITAEYKDDTASGIQISGTEVGDYTAYITGLNGKMASSYVIADGESTREKAWSITSGTNRYAADPSIADWTYGDTPSVPAAVSAFGTPVFVYSTSKEGNYTTSVPENAGTYYMKARVSGTADYAPLESRPVSFIINPSEITVTACDISGKEGDDIVDLNDPENVRYKVKGNVVSGDDLGIILSTTALKTSPAGDYKITAQVNAGSNYKVTTVQGTYCIIDKDLDLSVDSSSYTDTYDGHTHGVTVNVTGSDSGSTKVYYSKGSSYIDFATADELIADVSARDESPKRTDCGTTDVCYYVVYTKEGDGSKKVITKGQLSITITKAPLKVTAKDQQILFGNDAPEFGFTCSGFADGDDISNHSDFNPTYTCSYRKGNEAGDYEIQISGISAASASDYEISYAPGTLVVSAKLIVIGVSREDAVYDGEKHKGFSGTPAIEGTSVSSFEYAYEVKDPQTGIYAPVSGDASVAPADAGSYKVTIKVPDSDVHYAGSCVSVEFTIGKKTVSVIPRDQVIIAGGSISSGYVSYEGFIGDDNDDNRCISVDPDGSAIVSLAAGIGTSEADIGTHNNALIVGSGSVGILTDTASENYTLEASAIKGTLTVLKKDVSQQDKDQDNDDGGSSTTLGENSGTVRTAVITDVSELNPKLETDLSADKAEKLLDQDEKEKVTDEGKNALIYMTLTSAGDDASDEKDSIEDKAEELDENVETENILYLELSLYKKVGDDDPVRITNTTGTTVTITIKLTADQINSDPDKIRTYRIVYRHNGETKILTPDVSGGTLSFTTGEFSTYGIVYYDTEKVTPPAPGGDSGNNGGNGGNSGGQSSNNNDSDSSPVQVKNPAVTKPVTGTETPVTEPSGNGKQTETGSNQGNKGKGNGNKDITGNGESSADNGASSSNGSGKDSGNGNESGKGDSGTKEKDNKQTQKQTQKLTTDEGSSIGKETKEQLKDALDKILSIDPDIKAGPYVVLNSDGNGSSDINGDSGSGTSLDGSGKLTFDIPSDLQKDGRTFYVMAVAKDGSVVIIPNESIEDGTFSFSGDPDLTYQIIYEDGGAKLSENIGENGVLTGEDGKAVKVSTASGCFYHWIILVTGLIGIALLYIFRRKKKRPAVLTVTFAIDTALMIMLVMIGYCVWDKVFMVVGVVLMALVSRMKINSESFQKEQRSS